jgi:ElaA protein
MRWQIVFFDELSLLDLYVMGKLRQEVFVVEQDCPYVDFDGKDPQCWHVLGWDKDDELVAYTRIVPVGISYPEDASIGRVINAEKIRGKGIGYELMRVSMELCERLFPKVAIRISAQTHLEKFYGKLGFTPTGKYYLEDGIPHSEMVLKK